MSYFTKITDEVEREILSTTFQRYVTTEKMEVSRSYLLHTAQQFNDLLQECIEYLEGYKTNNVSKRLPRLVTVLKGELDTIERQYRAYFLLRDAWKKVRNKRKK